MKNTDKKWQVQRKRKEMKRKVYSAVIAGVILTLVMFFSGCEEEETMGTITVRNSGINKMTVYVREDNVQVTDTKYVEYDKSTSFKLPPGNYEIVAFFNSLAKKSYNHNLFEGQVLKLVYDGITIKIDR